GRCPRLTRAEGSEAATSLWPLTPPSATHFRAELENARTLTPPHQNGEGRFDASRNPSPTRQGRSWPARARGAARSRLDRPRREAAGRDRLRGPGRRGDQGRSLHPDGAGGTGDDPTQDR